MSPKTAIRKTELRYQVAIPIPYLDRAGGRLPEARRREWIRRVHEELHACFGGTLELPAPGTNVVGGKLLYEEGQTLVLSLCENKLAFRRQASRLEAFALKMGEALDQDAVLILASEADARILEVPRGTR